MLSPFRTRLAAGILLGLVVWFQPAAWRYAAPALSLFLAVCAPVAVRSASLALLLALPMLVAALLRRRFWCRRLCPVGLISESCGRLRGARAAGKPAAGPGGWPAGRYLALATLGGAVFGYPFLLWMDPLALFGGAFNAPAAVKLSAPPFSALGLPLLMLVSFLFPGAWCSRICALGATQDLLAMSARWASAARRKLRPEAPRRARRAFLALGAGSALSAATRFGAEKRPPLRPPGAVEETAFQGGCIRCGSCSRACPTGIIKPSVELDGVAGFLAPRLYFSGPNYCLQDCNLCGRVCPTGVIRPLALAAKNRHVIGLARIELEGCLLTREIECGVCIPRCPRQAIVDGFDRASWRVTVEVRDESCNGCGACAGICPPRVIHVEAGRQPPLAGG